MAWIALSYHESALLLAQTGVEDDNGRYGYVDLPALNLLHHAVELFYKSALNQRGISPPRTHNLATLEERCAQACPDLAFVIPRSLGAHKAGMADMFDDFPKRHFQSLGLRYRYPTEKTPGISEQRTDWAALVAEIEELKLSAQPIYVPMVLAKFSNRSSSRPG